MTPEQLKEALRLAESLAMKRVMRYRVNGGQTFTTKGQAQHSVDKARKELRTYLEQFVQPTEGEKQ